MQSENQLFRSIIGKHVFMKLWNTCNIIQLFLKSQLFLLNKTSKQIEIKLFSKQSEMKSPIIKIKIVMKCIALIV